LLTIPAKPSSTLIDPSVQELAVELRLAVGRLARRIRLSESAGLTPSQLSALATLDTHGPLRLVDVASHEGVAAPTALRVVSALESAGLVERSPDQADRRATRLSVTVRGRRELERIRRRREAYLQQQLSTLTPSDIAALRDALPVLRRLGSEGRP